MGRYISVIVKNDIHNRKDKEATKRFILETIEKFKVQYDITDNQAFCLVVDDETEVYSLQNKFFKEIDTLDCADGYWHISIPSPYPFAFFDEYISIIHEIIRALGETEGWVCEDTLTWRGYDNYADGTFEEWMENLKRICNEEIPEFPTANQLKEWDVKGNPEWEKTLIYHITLDNV